MLLNILTIKQLFNCFMEKNCNKQIKNDLGQKKKKLREKVIKLILNGEIMIIHLIVGLIKKTLLYKLTYFTEFDHSKNKLRVCLSLPNCALKPDLKEATGADKSDFAIKADLATLKSDFDDYILVN